MDNLQILTVMTLMTTVVNAAYTSKDLLYGIRTETNEIVPRIRRQTTNDNIFIPSFGPFSNQQSDQSTAAQTQTSQTHSSLQPRSPAIDPNSVDLTVSADGLVDYLVPPSVDASFSLDNFQEPSLNSQSSFDSSASSIQQSFQNVFPATTSQPSPSDNSPSFPNQPDFPPFPKFQSSDSTQNFNFRNSPASTTTSPSASSSGQFTAPRDTFSFQPNLSGQSSQQVNEYRNLFSVQQDPVIEIQQAKPSNSISFTPSQISRDAQNQYPKLESFNSQQTKGSRPIGTESSFFLSTSGSNNQFTKNEPVNQFIQNNQATQGKWDLGFNANDILSPPQHDSRSVQQLENPNPLFRRPTSSFNPSTNFFNDIPNQNQINSRPNKDIIKNNELSNNIKSPLQHLVQLSPPTSTPFLPTALPTAQSNFHNSPSFDVQNFNILSSYDPPLFNNFDPNLLQGTVADHTFFRRKRRSNNYEVQEEDEDDIQDNEARHSIGPVYSFVKTDKNGLFKWSVRHPARR